MNMDEVARQFAQANREEGTVTQQNLRRLQMDVLIEIVGLLREQNSLLKEDDDLED